MTPTWLPQIRKDGASLTAMLAVLLILIGCLPLMAAVTLYTLHSRAERRETQINASKTAQLLLNNFESTVASIDSLLQNFAAGFESSWTPDQAYEVLKLFSLPPTIVQVAVIDKNGRLIASNLARPNGTTVDLSDREHIRVHMLRNSATGDLFISKPVLGRVSKTWTIQLTRPLDDGNGKFGGIVVASYAISDFINFYKELRIEDDMLIALIGKDGVVRARAARNTSFGDDLSNSEVFRQAVERKDTIVEYTSPLDGVKRLAYSIQSDRYPIIVVVGYSLAFIEAQTRDFRNAIWGTAGGLAIALFILVLLAGRYVGMQKQINAREMEARARQREANVLSAISRVPDISVMHVTDDGPSEIGTTSAAPLAAAVKKYLRSPRFRALAAGLKEPILRQEHLTSGDRNLEVEIVIAPLDGMEGKAPGAHNDVVVFVVDQTARRIEEQKLYQISKLASLGEVATGLAHEINQPLGVIRLAASNALNGMKKGLGPEHFSAKLDRIIQQTVRMSRIIDHMRIFGRKSDDAVQPCRPSAAVEGAMQVVGAHLRLDKIEVDKRFDDNLPEVLCRQEQLEQVLINLLQNARDAILEHRKSGDVVASGRIRIDVAYQRTAAGPTIRIEVADNAGGIPAAVIERVFQPFFTTKPPGKGTGLGLSVSFGIVRDHGGSISVANGPEGAIFTLNLPAREPVPAEDELVCSEEVELEPMAERRSAVRARPA